MPKTIGEITIYSVKEVAEKLGTTERTLRGYIKGGRLRAQKVAGHYTITEESLRDFLNATPGSKGTK